MSEEYGLITMEGRNPLDLFQGDALTAILAGIESRAWQELDGASLDTTAGRKRFASVAYRVAQSKTFLDDAGKQLVADWKRQSAAVDVARRNARDFLDALKARIRQPLTDWEAAEAAKKAAEELARQIEADHGEAIQINEILDRERELARREAELKRQEDERRAREEAARQEAERIEREKEIAAQAEARAKAEAEERVRRAELAQAQAEARVKAEAEAAARRERERIEAEARAREAEAARAREEAEARARDREHQAEVNREALADLTGQGIAEPIARVVIVAIAKGLVRHVRIEY